MNKEDYFKYYIQGSDHYLIPKDVFKELFNAMMNWKEDTKKLKEVIDKVILIIKGIAYGENEDYYIEKLKSILDILKEAE